MLFTQSVIGRLFFRDGLDGRIPEIISRLNSCTLPKGISQTLGENKNTG